MKLNDARLTIMCNDGSVRITVEDHDANMDILELTVSSEQFVKALGRLACVEVQECEVSDHLDRLGKKLVVDKLEFELVGEVSWSNRNELAIEQAKAHTPEGWVADSYYASQNSFFTKDGKQYARTFIRTWK